MSYAATRDRVEDYFDRTATRTWERLTSDAPVSGIRATVRAGRDRMRDLILAQLPTDLTGASVLDAGCGTGALAVELAARGADVVAVDISPELLKIAQKRCPEGLVGRIKFASGDMLDESHGHRDLIVAMDSMIYYEPAVIASILGDLRPRLGTSMVFTEIENFIVDGAPWVPATNDNIVTGTAGDDTIGAGFTDADGTTIDAGDALGTHGEAIGSDADSVVGGAGNDSISSGLGADTVSGGDDNDTINDTSTSSIEIDRLELLDANEGNVVFSRVVGTDDLSLAITMGGVTETILVKDQFGSLANGLGLETLVFADGTTYSRSDISVVTGVTEAELDFTLTGTSADDTFDGGNGEDLLQGLGGADDLRAMWAMTGWRVALATIL